MPRKMIRAAVIFGAMLLSTALSQYCVAQLVPYDDSNSHYIDPAKWNGLQNFDPDLREALRQIVGDKKHGSLRLMQRAYSSTTDDAGGSGGVFGLAFPDPGAITEVSLAVTVDRVHAVSCSSNNSLMVTDAEFRGTFFNTVLLGQEARLRLKWDQPNHRFIFN